MIFKKVELKVALVLSAGIGSFTFYKLRSMDYISTTGSAKKPVISDKVKWTTNISRQTKLSTIKDGYARMDADLKEVNLPFYNEAQTPSQVHGKFQNPKGTAWAERVKRLLGPVQTLEVETVAGLASTRHDRLIQHNLPSIVIENPLDNAAARRRRVLSKA